MSAAPSVTSDPSDAFSVAPYALRPSTDAPSSPSAVRDGPARPGTVCKSCKRRKTRCDLVLPCSACSKTGLECVYPEGTRPESDTSSLSDPMEEQKLPGLAAVHEERLRLLGQVDELAQRLNLSQDDLVLLYESVEFEAPSPVAHSLRSRSVPVSKSGESGSRTPSEPSTKSSKKTASNAALTSHKPSPPHRVTRLSSAAASRPPPPTPSAHPPSSPSSSSRLSRRPFFRPSNGPPPLPTIDLSGRPHPARAYHFPITASTKAPMELEDLGEGAEEMEEEEEEKGGWVWMSVAQLEAEEEARRRTACPVDDGRRRSGRKRQQQ